MGGHAIRSSKRMDRDEYAAVCREITRILEGLHGIPMRITRTFDDKESFGDVDVIVDGSDVHVCVRALSPFETAKNGNIVSLGVELCGAIVQVDLIGAPNPSMIPQVLAYMSFGFFGMSVGIALHRHGLVYGMQGLETKDHPRVLLSSNSDEIMRFLGIDRMDDVRTARDLVETLSRSKIDLSVLERCAHKHDRLSPHVSLFREFARTIDGSVDLKESAIDHFGKRELLNAIATQRDQAQRIASKLNGNVVMDLTGLGRGPELGAFMAHLMTNVFTSLELFVDPQDAIDEKIKCAFAAYLCDTPGVHKMSSPT